MHHYAGFWRRFAAMWIDFFVLFPLMWGFMWIQTMSRSAALAVEVPRTAIFVGYLIYAHGRFGKTIGKHFMGIRVIRTDGRRIGWREAWLRSAPDVAFGTLSVCGRIAALTALTDVQYLIGAEMWRANPAVTTELPRWVEWSGWLSTAWIWSEVVVMLFNEKRRALHDFIAGTIVVRER